MTIKASLINPRPNRSYKDSLAYQRSNRTRHDGQPTFPLGFLDRPVPRAPVHERKSRFGLVSVLLICAAVAVALDRSR